MQLSDLAILRFQDGFMEKIWGGCKLRTQLGKRAPREKPIGEDWLVADHPHHESVVLEGPAVGMGLRQLVGQHAAEILGARPRLTPNGRFPLLLKLIDAAEELSVQVHPDDEQAVAFGEADAGKTEMWHVIQADPGAELICGLRPGVDAQRLARAVHETTVEAEMVHFAATPGMSVFVPAGTVHAIGGGIVLAEIQQNSDITYRLYDFGRVDAAGKRRELHLEKGLKVADYGGAFSGPARTLCYSVPGAHCEVLGACAFFAARRIRLSGEFHVHHGGASFHLLLPLCGTLHVSAAGRQEALAAYEGVLLAGGLDEFVLEGTGEVLDFWVPDLAADIHAPLVGAGHGGAAISGVLGRAAVHGRSE